MIPLKEDVEAGVEGGVQVWLKQANLDDAARSEMLAYTRTAEGRSDRAGRELFDDLVHKAHFIKTFTDLRVLLDVEAKHHVLEIGAGQAWASVLLKRWCPGAYTVASDLAPDAFRFTQNYESMLNATLDERWAFDVRAMPFIDQTFDRIFCFAAFHHFGLAGDYAPALAECLRVLRPGGRLIMLYEPSAPEWLYRRAHRRVNRRLLDDGVPEDVLVPSRLQAAVRSLGGTMEVSYYPQPRNRDGVAQTLYYAMLNRMPLTLGARLVSTVNITIEHSDEGVRRTGVV